MNIFFRKGRIIFLSILFFTTAMALAGCGGSDGSNPSGGIETGSSSLSLEYQTVTGVLDDSALTGEFQASTANSISASLLSPGTTLFMDDETTGIPLDGNGRFTIHQVSDGHHSLFVHMADGSETEIPFFMNEGMGLDFGTIHLGSGGMHEFSGFNGYHFGFVDEDGDGINDRFTDADGDGICDAGLPFSGHPYLMGMGFTDEDGDGVNDHYMDADGNGINDLNHMANGPGFGFVDADGNGICDQTGMPFSHPFGYGDENHDGINDHFSDSNGNGFNDRTGMMYVGVPGWEDLDGDGFNDHFADADGDGINDVTGMPYAHGFGWVDEDGDGINDRFVDEDGDGINDLAFGPFDGAHHGYGFPMMHQDVEGDGIDDETGMPYGHGFGWLDTDHDGINDMFTDGDGDGINDLTGYHYGDGFMHEGGDMHGGFGPGNDGPMDGPGDGMGGGMMQ